MSDAGDRAHPRGRLRLSGQRLSSRLPGQPWTLRVLGLLLLAVVLTLSYQATRTALALRAAKTGASTLRAQLAAGDQQGAGRTARDLVHQAGIAHDTSDGVLWAATTWIPFLGDDADAVRRLAAALDEASGAVPRALTLYDELGSGLRTPDGAIDLATVQALQSPAADMARQLTAAEREVAPVRPQDLLPGLSGQTAKALDDLRTVAAAARAGRTATRLLPQMMGADGPRRYVLVAQNNAEIRATGGLPGALVTLVVDKGKISLGGQRSYVDFPVDERPVGPLSAEEAAEYQTTLAYDLRDMTSTPDFPTAASRIAALVHRAFGDHVDGVLSVDPVTLAAVLRATGPVAGADGEQITGDNALAKLLNEPYQRFARNEEQDAYFAATTKSIFDRFLGGQITPALLTTLTEAVDQRRVLVWSQRPDEQEQLTGTAIAGGLPQGRSRSPQVGMYLNDGTAGKIEYYLRYRTTFASTRCVDGQQAMRATMTLHSDVPQDTSGLSKWVYGIGGYAPKGWMKLLLRVYAPTGGGVSRLEVDGKTVDAAPLPHEGRQVSFVEIMLKPGQTARVSADLVGAKGASADPVLEWTPGMTWGPTERTAPTTCS